MTDPLTVSVTFTFKTECEDYMNISTHELKQQIKRALESSNMMFINVHIDDVEVI